MNALELIGLLALIAFGVSLLNEFLDKQKEYQRNLDEDLRANREAGVKARELEDKRQKNEKENERIAKNIIEKKKVFLKQWKNVDPEEEYLIRVGMIDCTFFNKDLYTSSFSPWQSSVEKEKHPLNPKKENIFIKVDDIVRDYGISIQSLEMLYRGYRNEYANDEREFTDEDINIENLVSRSFGGETPIEAAKANAHQITLNKIIQTLEELRQIGIAKNRTPVYKSGID